MIIPNFNCLQVRGVNYVMMASLGTLLVKMVQSGHAVPAAAITTLTPMLWATVTESQASVSSAFTTLPASSATVAKRVSNGDARAANVADKCKRKWNKQKNKIIQK